MTLASAGRRSRTERLSRLAFHWSADRGTLVPWTGQASTFARTSPSGLVTGRDGVLVPAHTRDLPLFRGIDIDADGSVWEQAALVLGGARTNVCLQSEDFTTTWIDSGTPLVTANDVVAPNGTTTGDKIEDDSAAAAENRVQTITVADDSSTWCVSVYVRQQTSGPIALLRLRFTGGTVKDYAVAVDPSDGSTSATGSVDAPGDSGLADTVKATDGTSWYRVYVSGDNNSTGNTTAELRVYPAGSAALDASVDSAPTGYNHFWGAQFENAATPSPYEATTTGSVTRNADSLYWAYDQIPQAMTVYCKFKNRGTSSIVNARVLQIGGSTVGGDPRFALAGSTDDWRCLFDDGTASSDVSNVGSGAYGDVVELRGVLNTTGGVTLGVSVNSGAESTSSATGAGPPTDQAAWNDTRLYLNSGGSTNQGLADYIAVKIALGAARTMAQMRSLF